MFRNSCCSLSTKFQYSYSITPDRPRSLCTIALLEWQPIDDYVINNVIRINIKNEETKKKSIQNVLIVPFEWVMLSHPVPDTNNINSHSIHYDNIQLKTH